MNKNKNKKRQGGSWNKGRVIPPEVRAKMSAAMKGRKLSEEHKNKISKSLRALNKPGWNLGNTTPTEVREKISKTMTGKKKTEEHRRKISLGWQKRKERCKAEGKPVRKGTAWNKGKPMSAELRENLSRHWKGKPKPDAMRKAMSEGWARRRERLKKEGKK